MDVIGQIYNAVLNLYLYRKINVMDQIFSD